MVVGGGVWAAVVGDGVAAVVCCCGGGVVVGLVEVVGGGNVVTTGGVGSAAIQYVDKCGMIHVQSGIPHVQHAMTPADISSDETQYHTWIRTSILESPPVRMSPCISIGHKDHKNTIHVYYVIVMIHVIALKPGQFSREQLSLLDRRCLYGHIVNPPMIDICIDQYR